MILPRICKENIFNDLSVHEFHPTIYEHLYSYKKRLVRKQVCKVYQFLKSMVKEQKKHQNPIISRISVLYNQQKLFNCY